MRVGTTRRTFRGLIAIANAAGAVAGRGSSHRVRARTRTRVRTRARARTRVYNDPTSPGKGVFMPKLLDHSLRQDVAYEANRDHWLN